LTGIEYTFTVYFMESITAEELQARIREILNYGYLHYTNHVKEQMSNRNYDIGDIRHILQNGKIKNYKLEKKEVYKCEIYGEDLEGYMGGLVAVVKSNIRLIVITVLGGM
jgi:Domain of unknown function (DUF4258)